MVETHNLAAFGDRATTVRRMRASSNADTAVAQTIALMVRHIREGANDPIVQSAAGWALNGLSPDASDHARASAIWRWVNSNVRFQHDELSVLALPADRRGQLQDLLITPARLLTMPNPTGDCDDFSMLVDAMLMASGIPCELCTVAADESRPGVYTHVYSVALVGVDRQRFALDASHGDFAGWETSRAFRKAFWPVGGESMRTTLSGIERMKLRVPRDAPASAIDRQVLGRGMGFDWGAFTKILETGIDKIAAPVIGARYGAPPPGTYTQRNADGSLVQYRLGEGGSGFPAFQTLPAGSIGWGTIALLGGGIALAFALSGNRGRR